MFGNTKRFAIFVYQIGMMKISKNIYFFFNDVVIDEKGTILSWNVKHMTLSKWQSLTAQYKVIFTRWCDAIKSNHRDQMK